MANKKGRKTEDKMPTRHELTVLRVVAEAGTVARAAAALGLSENTVEARIDNLRDKTGMRYIAGIVLHLCDKGLLPRQEADSDAPTEKAG